jgi:hypothetical protein
MDNSPRYCSQGLVGGTKQHTCADGTTFTCSAGTRDCMDNSPTYCTQSDAAKDAAKDAAQDAAQDAAKDAAKGMVGGKEQHTCADGTTFTCSAGTRDCKDNSSWYCNDSAKVAADNAGELSGVKQPDPQYMAAEEAAEEAAAEAAKAKTRGSFRFV